MRKQNVLFYDQLANNEGGITKSNLETPNIPEITNVNERNFIEKEKYPNTQFFSISGNNYSYIEKKNLETSNVPEYAIINKLIPYTYYIEYDSNNKQIKPGAELRTN